MWLNQLSTRLNALMARVDDYLKHKIGLPRIDTTTSEEAQKEARRRQKAEIDAEIAGHLIARRHFASDDQKFMDIFDVIDRKASAILTHISVMIAVNAFVLNLNLAKGANVATAITLVLFILFIVVALLTLRLLRFWSDRFPGTDHDGRPSEEVAQQVATSFSEEAYYRGRLYKLALNITTALTFLSALLIVWQGLALLLR